MKNILIASDSFKGSLSSKEVANSIKKGILRANKSLKISTLSCSDGGEGFLDSIYDKIVDEKKFITIVDAFNKEINTYYLIRDKRVAIIEMALTCGFKKDSNPLLASTYPIGLIIKDAINNGIKTFIIGIGGSCTNDAGYGMLYALGAKFNYMSKRVSFPTLDDLSDISSVNLEDFHKLSKDIKVYIANDVKNPLFGKNGATYIFGGQKGIKDLALIDKRIKNFSSLFKGYEENAKLKGSGAAGGLGFALSLFKNYEFISSIDLIIKKINFSNFDLLITGEGRLDTQSIKSKVVYPLCRIAKLNGLKTLVFTGVSLLDKKLEYVDDIIEILKESLEYSINNAATLLEEAAYDYFKKLLEI